MIGLEWCPNGGLREQKIIHPSAVIKSQKKKIPPGARAQGGSNSMQYYIQGKTTRFTLDFPHSI